MRSSIFRLGLIILLVSGSIGFGTGCAKAVTSTVTFGELSQNGAALFSSLCALCHGQEGGGGFGPPVIGVNANLWKYYTAQGLLYFIETAMPFNAPGSLTHQQYLNDMGFLMVSNGYIIPEEIVPEGELEAIVLPQPSIPAPPASTQPPASSTAKPTSTTGTVPTTTPTSVPTTSSTVTNTTVMTNTTPATTGQTYQTLASQGGSVYSSTCSVCHGNNGQGGIGPALWGSNATLGTYKGTTLFNKNAQDMLNFISTKMPLTAPGSLSSEQYVNVLCYILIQNNLVSPSKVFDETQLSSITLG